MNNIIGIAFLVFILGIFIYRANEGFDIIAPQFFYLSILGALYFLFRTFLAKKIFIKENYIIPSLLLLLILYGILTSIWAYNISEVFITAGQFFTIYLIIYSFISLPNNHNFNGYLSTFVLIFLLIENIWSFKIITEYILADGYIGRNLYFSGMSANPNITAFSTSLKLAIIPFFIKNLKYEKLVSLIFGILIFGTTLLILFLGSRGGYIALFLAISGILFFDIKGRAWKKLLIKIFLISLSFSVFSYLNDGKTNLIERVATINPKTKDGSIDQRLRFYGHSLELIKENPLGIGLGNWKIESINKEKNYLTDFIIPYHSHNDFLELLSELGIFGLLYIMIFIILLRHLYKKVIKDYKYAFIIIGVLIFLIDSNLNFPIYRPIMTVNLSLLLYFSYNYEV